MSLPIDGRLVHNTTLNLDTLTALKTAPPSSTVSLYGTPEESSSPNLLSNVESPSISPNFLLNLPNAPLQLALTSITEETAVPNFSAKPKKPVTYHSCNVDNCDYKARYASHVKQHRMDKHDIAVVWHHCDQKECIYKAKTPGHIKRHKAYKHNVGVTWHFCEHMGCEYKAKAASEITKHKSYRHDENVVWHDCDMPDCTYKAKTQFEIKRHKTHKHNVGVTWHFCDSCDYKAKAVGNIIRHKKLRHDPNRKQNKRSLAQCHGAAEVKAAAGLAAARPAAPSSAALMIRAAHAAFAVGSTPPGTPPSQGALMQHLYCQVAAASEPAVKRAKSKLMDMAPGAVRSGPLVPIIIVESDEEDDDE